MAHHSMRTTLTLDDDAFATAQAYARARAIKLGQAVSELILRDSEAKVPMKRTCGVWVFDLPPNTPTISASRVRRLLGQSS